MTAVSWLRVFCAVAVGGVPFSFVFQVWLGGYWWLAGWILGGLTGIPIDKFIDERFRHLEKHETKNAA
jgi:hypothetical protein